MKVTDEMVKAGCYAGDGEWTVRKILEAALKDVPECRHTWGCDWSCGKTTANIARIAELEAKLAKVLEWYSKRMLYTPNSTDLADLRGILDDKE
jgi:hypothetical protein